MTSLVAHHTEQCQTAELSSFAFIDAASDILITLELVQHHQKQLQLLIVNCQQLYSACNCAAKDLSCA